MPGIIKSTLGNIGINDGEPASQTIMHLHINLIPRYKDNMDDPRGGERGVISEKKKYLK
ncbi:HIT family protein [Methanospirillum sp.]|uniref:HIT family protein n=1 Tax=Methanospirillum sp. TaxID=45200 RepID=UPI0035A172A5